MQIYGDLTPAHHAKSAMLMYGRCEPDLSWQICKPFTALLERIVDDLAFHLVDYDLVSTDQTIISALRRQDTKLVGDHDPFKKLS